jgi:XTP/dITP diphosphohydrolase
MMTNHLKPGMRLVVASHNPGKVWEIKQLIAPFGLEAVSAADLELAEPEETETTFAANARLKALAAARASKLPALADDSGLEVACLGGAPGIYSARWAGPAKDFSLAMRKVAEEVSARHGWAAPGPKANFLCVLCLAWPDGQTELFEGRVDGVLVWPPRGGNGFGYDPMFVPEGQSETFGEMDPAQKHAMSHRARAFEGFRAARLEGIDAADGSDSHASQGGGAYEGLAAAAANLSTRMELATFVGNLCAELDAGGNDGKQPGLLEFLDALRAWAEKGEKNLEEEPRWRLLAKALLAASHPK